MVADVSSQGPPQDADLDAAIERSLADARRRNLAWVQVDVGATGLSERDDHVRPVSLSATAIASVVAPVARESGARRWWFVRKAPGVRVRMEAKDDHDALQGSMLAALAPLGTVRASVYEAESHRFGGVEGMDVAHDHFTLDTVLGVLAARHAPPLTAHAWSVAALGDLAARLVADGAEQWDTWRRVGAMLDDVLRRLPGADPAAAAEGAIEVVAAAASDRTEAPGPDIPPGLLVALRDGNERVAGRLAAAPLSGGVGPRTWFASVAVFHWNRLGFGPYDMAAVTAEVLAALGGSQDT